MAHRAAPAFSALAATTARVKGHDDRLDALAQEEADPRTTGPRRAAIAAERATRQSARAAEVATQTTQWAALHGQLLGMVRARSV